MRLARRFGVPFSIFNIACCLDANVSPTAIADEFSRFLERHAPQVLVVPHVVYKNGCVLPIADLARIANAAACLLVVDGAQVPGMMPLRLGESDIAVYAASLHKWFCGGVATGFLYLKPGRAPRIEPVLGFGPVRGMTLYGDCPPNWSELIDKYFQGVGEHCLRGSPNYPMEVGLAEAISFHDDEATHAEMETLTTRAHAFLAKLEACAPITAVSPRHATLRSAMVAFQVEGLDPETLTRHLAECHRVVIRTVSDPFSGWAANRVCFGWMNDDNDADEAVVRIRKAIWELT